MDDEIRTDPGRKRRLPWAVLVPALLLLGCAGSPWQAREARRPDTPRTAETYCVQEPVGTLRGRTINYVDPELCGRSLQGRPRQHVRVTEGGLVKAGPPRELAGR
jgi:hypothetical protein